jgi:hypothetical protein
VIPRSVQITLAFLLATVLLLGTYILHVRHSEEAKTQAETAETITSPQAQGRWEKIRILVAYDDDQTLRWRDADAFLPTERAPRAKAILRVVLSQYVQSPSPHPLASTADIREVYLLGQDTLLVDTSAAFADAHPSGVLLEQMTITSLIETLTANLQGVNRVKFLVEGRERETLSGHADLMTYYSASEVHKFARELE